MPAINVVVVQSDARVAESLAAALQKHFHCVHVARNLEELRAAIPKQRAQVAIVDMEIACLSEVQKLHRDFSSTCIVCTHRLADEEMWTMVLEAGAADICRSSDVQGILFAALRNAHPARSATAAA